MQSIDSTSPTAPSVSSLTSRMLNILACPGEVFHEVVTSRDDLGNWRGPTFLVCLTGMIGLCLRLHDMARADFLAGSIIILLAALGGSIWSAFVLWFISRAFLKVAFSFPKALEVAGLAGMVTVLGNLVTTLLAVASGKNNIELSLGWLFGSGEVAAVFRYFNLFHLWGAAVLSVALSELAKVSRREAAFWVFGYWLLARILLALLVPR